MLYIFLRWVALVLFKLFFRLQVFGRAHIPAQGGFILASNHISYLDPPAIGIASPRILSFLAKEGLFRHPLAGAFFANINVFPLKTHSGDIRSLRWAIRELRAQRPVTIFPEGERVIGGELGKPLQGIGFLVAKTEVPIIPAFIEGSDKALPVHGKFIRPKKIKVYFGRPFQPEINKEIGRRNFYQTVAEATMEEISKLREYSKAAFK